LLLSLRLRGGEATASSSEEDSDEDEESSSDSDDDAEGGGGHKSRAAGSNAKKREQGSHRRDDDESEPDPAPQTKKAKRERSSESGSEDHKDRRSRRRTARHHVTIHRKSPAEKLEKYKRLVKKLEEAKVKLQSRHSKVELMRKEQQARAVTLKLEIKESIIKLQHENEKLNQTLKETHQKIHRYVYETPRALQGIKALRTLQLEVQDTLNKLTVQKFKLMKQKAEKEAQREVVALRTKVILLERKLHKKELEVNMLQATGGTGKGFITQLGGKGGVDMDIFEEM